MKIRVPLPDLLSAEPSLRQLQKKERERDKKRVSTREKKEKRKKTENKEKGENPLWLLKG